MGAGFPRVTEVRTVWGCGLLIERIQVQAATAPLLSLPLHFALVFVWDQKFRELKQLKPNKKNLTF